MTSAVDRRAALAPVGQQRVEPDRVEHRAGQDVRADLRALLEHDDAEVGVALLQPDRRRRGPPGRRRRSPRRSPWTRARSRPWPLPLSAMASVRATARGPSRRRPGRQSPTSGQPRPIRRPFCALAARVGGSYVAASGRSAAEQAVASGSGLILYCRRPTRGRG